MTKQGTKQALDAKRMNAFAMDPNNIVIIGLDTKDGKEHPLWDMRVGLPLNEAMVRNIMRHGVLEPVLVRKDGDVAVCVAGRQRIKNAREANKRLIAEGAEPILVPCMVKRASDESVMGIMISENEIRSADEFTSKINKLERFLATGKTEEDAAIVFGVTKQTIKNWLSILEAGPEVKSAVKSGEISATTAANIAKLPRAEQGKLVEDAKVDGDGKRPSVEKIARKIRAAKTGEEAKSDIPGKKVVNRLLLASVETDLELGGAGENAYEKGFLDAIKWMRGDLSADRIKNLKRALKAALPSDEPAE